ncbi:hypothetical protein GLYMA_18G234467v4 [Glycine max]|nr:hypothetical protein GLYMA_18G234467v4 [Glycine max]
MSLIISCILILFSLSLSSNKQFAWLQLYPTNHSLHSDAQGDVPQPLQPHTHINPNALQVRCYVSQTRKVLFKLEDAGKESHMRIMRSNTGPMKSIKARLNLGKEK